MILMNNPLWNTTFFGRKAGGLLCCCIVFLVIFGAAGCGIYSFNSASIPPEIKTVKIGFIENKARYINPQLSPRLNDRLQQKITGTTRLTRTNNDDAHYQISGYISQYDVSTAGVSSQQAATNRLTVGIHIKFADTYNNKVEEFDISRNFDFSANLSLPQAEGALMEDIVRNLSDEIFNRIFAKW